MSVLLLVQPQELKSGKEEISPSSTGPLWQLQNWFFCLYLLEWIKPPKVVGWFSEFYNLCSHSNLMSKPVVISGGKDLGGDNMNCLRKSIFCLILMRLLQDFYFHRIIYWQPSSISKSCSRFTKLLPQQVYASSPCFMTRFGVAMWGRRASQHIYLLCPGGCKTQRLIC